MIDIALLIACAPTVAHQTTAQIMQIESAANPIALNVNGTRITRKPRDADDAAAMARRYIAQGYTVDLGLMQINSVNLLRLGYTVEDMFEPCKNIAAGGRIITDFYRRAKTVHGDDQHALLAALSAYNTGNFQSGFSNGYVAKYIGKTPVELPTSAPSSNSTISSSSKVEETPLNPFTASTVIFIRKKEDVMKQDEKTLPVISESENDLKTPGVQVEYTPAEAERMGAFQETAMSESDAWESNADLAANGEAGNEAAKASSENGEIDANVTAIIINGRSVLH